MKKLHSLAFCALVTPALALGTGAVLAQQPTGQDYDRPQESTQPAQGEQETHRLGESESQKATELQQTGDPSHMHDRGFISTAPASGIQASDLIGAKVRSTDDENVGSVDDVIIDENGQVVAIIVGVGGFLGLGQKDVAISWDNVTRSGAADDPELRVDVTRESLLNAPEFERRD